MFCCSQQSCSCWPNGSQVCKQVTHMAHELFLHVAITYQECCYCCLHWCVVSCCCCCCCCCSCKQSMHECGCAPRHLKPALVLHHLRSMLAQMEVENLHGEVAHLTAARAADKQHASSQVAGLRQELQASQEAEQAREEELNELANAREVVQAELAGKYFKTGPCWQDCTGNARISGMRADACHIADGLADPSVIPGDSACPLLQGLSQPMHPQYRVQLLLCVPCARHASWRRGQTPPCLHRRHHSMRRLIHAHHHQGRLPALSALLVKP